MALTTTVLAIGGGGGGGAGFGSYSFGGGGGAGDYAYNAALLIDSGAHTVTIGAGGAGGPSTGNAGYNGSDTSLGSFITAIGGGGAGGGSNSPHVGKDGGSGGGGGHDSVTPVTGGGGASTGLDGNAGGSAGTNAGGGGGGAGAIGGGGGGGAGGGGGNGTSNSITGSAVIYAGGGGGAGSGSGGAGGTGGGGTGGAGAGGSTNGTANTGGGAGGGNVGNAGAGGSGIVIIRYLTADVVSATGGTITTDGSYSVHSFTASGTFTLAIKPSVSTEVVSDIGFTTATGNGTVTSDGGAAISERGICWSTSTAPTTSNDKATSAGTVGAFTAAMTGLTSSTHYYVRAYAINANGTAYGSEVVFDTSDVSPGSVYKEINGIDGETYAVSVYVGGTVGSVTAYIGTTGYSQVISAAAGTTVFSGVYGGLRGLIFTKSATFNGYIEDVMYVRVTGSAAINWALNTLTNIFSIDSSVLFRRIEAKEFNTFRFFRYLDLLFKDLSARVTVTVKQEQSDNVREKTATFLVENSADPASPFIKKKISFLSKSQAILIGLSNNNLNDTFTICRFDLKGYEENKRLFEGSSIINVV